VPTSAAIKELLEPLRNQPEAAAVLLDVDGTLAPIVERPEEAIVPEGIRSLLIEISGRYGLLACISGRPATEARRMVSLGSIPYIGNHGAELLEPGGVEPEPLGEPPAPLAEQLRRHVEELHAPVLAPLRVAVEHKGPIVALHWRGAPDPDQAQRALERVAEEAAAQGYAVHWGRKVLELRQPGLPDKGLGVRELLRRHGGPAVRRALYLGDERTDLDAFAALEALREEGALELALRVAIGSAEAPPELLERADHVLPSQREVSELLAALL